MSKALPSTLKTWLLESVDHGLACSASVPDIDVLSTISRAKAVLYLCRVSCHQESRRICVKTFTDIRPTDANRLFRRARIMEPSLQRAGLRFPRFISIAPDDKTIVMSYVDGAPLENALNRSFYRGARYAQHCCDLIESLAKTQAQLSAISVPADDAFASPASNNEWTERLRPILDDPFVKSCLKNSALGTDAGMLSEAPDYGCRVERQLLHGDFQAKNVLIDDEGRISLIDLSYQVGNPMFDVAQFLVQLLRLDRRSYSPLSSRRIRGYGEVLIETLFSNGFDHLRKDLPLFILWAAGHSLLADARYPAPIRAYVRRHFRESSALRSWLTI